MPTARWVLPCFDAWLPHLQSGSFKILSFTASEQQSMAIILMRSYPQDTSSQRMSLPDVERFIRNAQQQVLQGDINASILRAVVELMGEAKRIDDDIRRVR
jgi:hypothetical protein